MGLRCLTSTATYVFLIKRSLSRRQSSGHLSNIVSDVPLFHKHLQLRPFGLHWRQTLVSDVKLCQPRLLPSKDDFTGQISQKLVHVSDKFERQFPGLPESRVLTPELQSSAPSIQRCDHGPEVFIVHWLFNGRGRKILSFDEGGPASEEGFRRN